MLKKILFFICFLITLGLLIVGGFHYFSAQKEAEYATTAVPYVKQVIPELSKWDPTISKRYMSQEFLAKISTENFKRIIQAMARLGTLEQLDEPKFEEIYSGRTIKGAKQVILSYSVKARYSSGEADVTLSLVDNGGKFEVYRFNVHSAALR